MELLNVDKEVQNFYSRRVVFCMAVCGMQMGLSHSRVALLNPTGFLLGVDPHGPHGRAGPS